MGLAEVRKAVTKNAEAEAEAILVTARAEADEILRSARERITAERAAFDAETKKMLEILGRREMSAANAQSKAIILDAKRSAVNDAFAAARQALMNLDGRERDELLAMLADRAREEVEIARIRAAPRDVQALVRLFPNASCLADATISGGFIATDGDGRIAVDVTFDTLLADVHDKELLPVSEILFGQHRSGGKHS